MIQMIASCKRLLPKPLGFIPIAMLLVAVGMAEMSWATTNFVTWSSQPDFENNAATTGTQTTRKDIDTATVPGDVRIGVSKDLLNTATITCNAADNKVYTTGAERASVAVIDSSTKALIRTITLPARPSGVVYNSTNNKLYVGYYNEDKVSVIDGATDTIISTVTVGNGAYAAAYNPTDNKVYIANMADQTVTVLNGATDTVIATVPVVAGPYTATYHLAVNKVYITNKFNQFMSIIDGTTDQVVETVAIEQVVSILGGQASGSVGLRASAQVMGITAADKVHLSWNYDPLASTQKIQFQVRTASDVASLDAALYRGPDGTADTWYDPTATGATTVTEADGTRTSSLILAISYAPAVEIQVRLSADDLATPVLHGVTLAFESYSDLTSTSVSGPATGVIGSTVDVSTSVANQGTEAAANFKVGIYLYNVANGTSYFLGDRTIASLAPGANDTGDITVTLPTVPTGDYNLQAVADYANVVAEGNETNNSVLGNAIYIASVQPDLVIKSVTGTVSNGQLTYSMTVKNQGVNTTGQVYINIYLSADTTISASDNYISYYLIWSSLAGGAQETVTRTVNLPAGIPNGNYYVGALADIYNNVSESDETNNGLASTVTQYVYNDLVVTAVSGTVANGQLTYSTTIRNLGNGMAGQFSNHFYLSADTSITTSDYIAGDKWTYQNLAGGAQTTLTGTGNLPAGIPNGNYYVGAIADAYNHISESDETNNVLASNDAQYVNNDLVVTAVSGTVANGQLTYSVTIKNLGNGVSGPFNTYIYLSADTNITASDYFETYQWIPQNLAGGAQSTLTGTGNLLPGIPSGDYYVGALADYYNTTIESDETNNGLAGNQVSVP